MARPPRGRDWQERAFEETELKRRDTKAGVPSDVPDPMRATSDFTRRSSWRWTLIGLAVIIVAGIVRAELNNRPPSLTTDCQTPAFALSSLSPKQGGVVRWSATGPASMHFVITLGIDRLGPGTTPGVLRGVPEAGHTSATTEQAVLAHALSSDCKAHGAFTVDVPSGTYTVKLFRLGGTGATATGTEVATKVMTVKAA
ncbi:MAG: hypothetical protein JO246_08715 [Frankiaceae bacterium]|nr:hypothetical protein [Frankiaceae bacterium]MBV9871774.1 hypothetical protein [Frankiaceae bacterium]